MLGAHLVQQIVNCPGFLDAKPQTRGLLEQPALPQQATIMQARVQGQLDRALGAWLFDARAVVSSLLVVEVGDDSIHESKGSAFALLM